MKREVLIGVVGALFVTSVIGVALGFSVPKEKEITETRVTYKLEGNFDHQAYEKFVPEVESSPRYFMKIIDSVDVFYSYRFAAEAPVKRVSEEVAIDVVIASGGNWEKVLPWKPRVKKEGDFTISFPLDTESIIFAAKTIGEGVGAGGSTPEVTLRATVDVVAVTGAGVVEDTFIQEAKVRITEATLEWDKDLSVSEISYNRGLKYEQQGDFSYAVNLKPNLLFGAITLEPEIPPAGEPVAIEPEEAYPSETIDHIDGTFSYDVGSSETLQGLASEVEVTATLGTTGGQQETFSLVPKSQKIEDFSVTFPLDIPLYYAIIREMEGETDETETSYPLMVKAVVHTTGSSYSGEVDETFSDNVTIMLKPDEVEWPETEPETIEGSIEETTVVSNPNATTARVGTLGAMVMMATVLFYVIWSYREYRRKWISRIEADELLVKGKHRDLVVDVAKLPEIKDDEAAIELDSLEELVKVAESLLKPVLRLAEKERHIYCVIDGETRYQYTSKLEYISYYKHVKLSQTEESGEK